MKFAIMVFDDVEVLDAFGPFEVFSVAARLQTQHDDREQVSPSHGHRRPQMGAAGSALYVSRHFCGP